MIMKNAQAPLWLLSGIFSSARARQSGWGGGEDGSGWPGFGSSSSSDDGSSGSNFADFDVDGATSQRRIHGILAAVAFVILFPLGAILMRIVPGRFAIWMHGLTQLVAYVLFIAAAALGFMLIRDVQLPYGGGSLLTISSISYHPIIGIVVFVTLFFQPILGFIHHNRFKKVQRRTMWSHLHLWNGRLMIVLGIVNGGLGLRVSGASDTVKLAYTIVAAIMGSLWVGLAIVSECRRSRGGRKRPDRVKEVVNQHSAQSRYG